jgi:hypothetical protein
MPPSETAALGVGQFVEDALTVFEKSLPFKGQRQLARRAQQQLDAEAGLESIEPTPDHRRRDPSTCAAAERLPRVAELTKASICLIWSIDADLIPEVKDTLILFALIFHCSI